MDQAEVDTYLAKVPSVIINATAPLGDKKCWALYIALLDSDEGLRFNQLKGIFKAESPEISRSLKSLANAGLITKRARRLADVGNNEVSYYVPTILGESLIKSLYRGMLPSKPIGIRQAATVRAEYAGLKGSNTGVRIRIGDRVSDSTKYSRSAPQHYGTISGTSQGCVSHG